MPKITILVGPPSSGKTTWCNNYKPLVDGEAIRINQDEQGKDGHKEIFFKALKEGKNIFLDRMNFNISQRRRYLDPAKTKGYDTEIVVFHVSMSECLHRCNGRENHPTIKDEETARKAVTFFFKNYERVEDDETNKVTRLGWVDSNASKCVVCDLDGTLANVEHRRKYVQVEKPEKPNWKKFFDTMGEDKVNKWCSELLKNMNDNYFIVYATGRPGDYMDITKKWLDKYNLRFPFHSLFSRLEGDYRKDSIVKEIILEFEIKTRYNILFVVDDRKQVVEKWRQHGYVVLQCDKGDF